MPNSGLLPEACNHGLRHPNYSSFPTYVDEIVVAARNPTLSLQQLHSVLFPLFLVSYLPAFVRPRDRDLYKTCHDSLTSFFTVPLCASFTPSCPPLSSNFMLHKVWVQLVDHPLPDYFLHPQILGLEIQRPACALLKQASPSIMACVRWPAQDLRLLDL